MHESVGAVTNSLFSYPGTDAEEGEVRLELAEGQSRLPGWRFFASEGEQRVLVGSSHDCDWQVVAQGVAPHHLELVWAGDILWVAPVGDGLGSVWLQNAPVQEWTRIESDTEICFGEARIGVGGVTDLYAPTVISSVDQFAQAQPAEPSAAPAPAEPRRSGFETVEPVTVPVGVPARVPSGVPAPPPDKTAMTDLEDLRRWRDSCVEENRAGAAAAPPRPGAASPPPVPVATSRAPMASPSTAPAATRAPQPMMANLKQAPAPAPLADEPRVAGSKPASSKASGGKRLAAPPPVAAQQTASAAEPKRSFVELARDVIERVTFTIPSRVAIGAIAVFFVVALLLLHDRVGAKDDPPHSKPAPTPSAPSVTKITPEPSPRAEPAETLDPEERVSEEGRAARLVAAGRLAEALPVYERLLANDPANDAFAITIRVIRHQLAAKCKAAGGTGGEPCEEAP